MALRIYPGFDIDELSAGVSLQLTDSGGTDTITVSTGTFAHVDFSAVSVNGTTYSDFASEIQSDINASGTLAGTYAVTFSESTFKYTVSCTETFSMTPSGTADDVMGFSSGVSGSTSYDSDTQVKYAMDAEEEVKSAPASDEYKMPGTVKVLVADDGSTYSVEPSTTPTLEDWWLKFEPHDKMFSRIGTYVWTWEDFWGHCSARFPFLVKDNGTNKVHSFRKDGVPFTRGIRQRANKNRNFLWHIQFLTYMRGRL